MSLWAPPLERGKIASCIYAGNYYYIKLYVAMTYLVFYDGNRLL